MHACVCVCAYVYLRATSDVEAAVYSASGTPMHPTPLSGAACHGSPLGSNAPGTGWFGSLSSHREDTLSSCDLCTVVIFMACVRGHPLCGLNDVPQLCNKKLTENRG